MSPLAAQIILLLAAAYAGIGVLVAIPFVARGAQRIDPAARGAPIGFRLMILPGVAALWPLLLKRWLAAPPKREAPHP